MFPLPFSSVIGGVLLVLTALLGIQTYRLDSLQEDFNTFETTVKVRGEDAEKLAKAKDKANKLNMEKVNAENTALMSRTNKLVKQLRDSNPVSSIVPPAPATSSRPDLACFDRREYVGATGTFIERVRGLADEGTAATIDLDSAKNWAQHIN